MDYQEQYKKLLPLCSMDISQISQKFSQNKDEVQGHITELQNHASDLKNGNVSVQEVQQKLSSSNNPAAKSIGDKLQGVSNNEEAQKIINDHVGALKDHLGSL